MTSRSVNRVAEDAETKYRDRARTREVSSGRSEEVALVAMRLIEEDAE